jgi:hypothetical protein
MQQLGTNISPNVSLSKIALCYIIFLQASQEVIVFFFLFGMVMAKLISKIIGALKCIQL